MKNEALVDLHKRFSSERKNGRQNWKELSTALTSLNIGPARDPEACRKRWRQHKDKERQDLVPKAKKWTVVDVN